MDTVKAESRSVEPCQFPKLVVYSPKRTLFNWAPGLFGYLTVRSLSASVVSPISLSEELGGLQSLVESKYASIMMSFTLVSHCMPGFP